MIFFKISTLWKGRLDLLWYYHWSSYFNVWKNIACSLKFILLSSYLSVCWIANGVWYLTSYISRHIPRYSTCHGLISDRIRAPNVWWDYWINYYYWLNNDGSIKAQLLEYFPLHISDALQIYSYFVWLFIYMSLHINLYKYIQIYIYMYIYINQYVYTWYQKSFSVEK